MLYTAKTDLSMALYIAILNAKRNYPDILDISFVKTVEMINVRV